VWLGIEGLTLSKVAGWTVELSSDGCVWPAGE
jgi:hypothetical protein